MSYWTFTDIFKEAGPRTTPFHGGFGLINYQDIKRPAFRAYEYLNKLGATKLKCDVPQTLVTRDQKGGVQALFWDFTNDIPANTNNQAYYITDIHPKPKAEVNLQISNLKPGSYKVTVYRVGYRINDPYPDYLDLGRPSQLTRAQVDKIKSRNDGKPVRVDSIKVSKEGVLNRKYDLRENDVYFIQISKE